MKKQSRKSGDIPMLFIEFHNWRRAQPAYKRFGLRSLPTGRQIEWPFWRGKPFYFQTPFPALKIDRPKMKKRAMSTASSVSCVIQLGGVVRSELSRFPDINGAWSWNHRPSNWPLSVTESVVLPPMNGSVTVPQSEQVLVHGDLHQKSKWSVAIAFSALVAATPSAAESNAQAGKAFAQANCSHCHSIDKVTRSTLAIAPAFRTLHLRYPVESLEEALGEGIATGHPSMPEFRLDPGQVGDFISFLKSLEQ